VHHRGEDKVERQPSKFDGIAVFHLFQPFGEVVEAAEHVEGLFVSDDFDAGVELSQECQRTAVVRLHVVHHHVVDGPVAQYLADVLYEWHEEVDLHGVDECHLLAHHQVGIVAHALRQGP